MQTREELERTLLLMREKKRRANLPSAKKNYAMLYDWQRDFIAATGDHLEACLCAANRTGKAAALDTPILTNKGWTTHGSVSVGDMVATQDGSFTEVVSVHPQGVRPCYRVTMDRGETVVVDEDHLWQVTLPSHRYAKRRSHGRWEENPNYGKQTVVTTRHLVEAYYKHDGEASSARQRCTIPVVEPVEFEKVAVPLDPYLMGVLLGDGGMSHKTVTLTKNDQSLIDEAGSLLPEGDTLIEITEGQYRIKGAVTLGILRDFGLQGKRSWEKHIPDEYLFNDVGTRLSVLQGLMDTDGTVSNPKTGSIEYSTTSQDLCEGVKFLVQSLGGRVSIRERITKFTYKGETKAGRLSYRVYIKAPHVDLFRLERKKSLSPKNSQFTRNPVIKSIVPVAPQGTLCITVAHPSHLYVVKDFIVTHNSMTGITIDAMHLTGDYPDDWEGYRFDFPPLCWLLGYSMEKTRDILQEPLFGKYHNKQFEGGLIPKERIHSWESAMGTPNAMRTVRVKHRSGQLSKVQFWSYSQGQHALMGDSVDWAHTDEEPVDPTIRPQVLTRLATGDEGRGGRAIYTFTPENGLTELVKKFMDETGPDRFFMQKGWDDVSHLDEKWKANFLESIPAHQRDMRTKGTPMLGDGQIYDVPHDMVLCDPVPIEDHWYVINGMDFGYDHPQAHVQLAIDQDNDIIYVTHSYKARKTSAVEAYQVVKPWSEGVPVAWPHDGLITEKGRENAKQQKHHWEEAGFSLLSSHSTWPEGGISVEKGVMEIRQMMLRGQFKIFKGQPDLMLEMSRYRREAEKKDGGGLKIVKTDDDLLDAMRYAYMMRRYAEQKAYLNKPYDDIKFTAWGG